ncbi:DUF3006 family protein [Marinilactibacillus psychrotolerans]|uniref:DUF3006 family protein n=2 Tax=Marinilactibacillus psychrotolerans TaxID=191770 RepID=A0A511GXR2_9LACT|nr:DUF3006 family protein [Marinilactibacillus psychrotolerans]TLQ07688.1 DUF3006 family protein [Marinilactibacillus psychrotolerans]SDB99952.1 Protein of unknown function [Marinilactibacillus psychrotolerans]SJN21473.1 hypothetical protein FM115_01920 [Marinilactibacillus psychrotolerans 42ea]GEL66048.1 hypothetical protein MPS01_02030 [Marinilactibacillus psychrotolerans]GEQ34557.1 hypothetical protein M132T_00650 [Marinilactibacillus psychrotolerans]
MIVVFESLENNKAKLVPDDKSDEIILTKDKLPDDCKVGDVLEIEPTVIDGDNKLFIKVLRAETQKRLQNNKKRREKLLKRKH